jgi:hypothetical protein
MGGDYFPGSDSGMCRFGDKFIEYSTENCEKWGIKPISAEIITHFNDFKAKVEICQQPERSKADTIEKNLARKTVEKELRGYIRGLVAHNPAVTDADRERMGLPVYDKIPTTVGKPQGRVTVTVVYLGGQTLEIRLEHEKGTPFDPKANYGNTLRCRLCGADEPEPVNIEVDMPKTLFTRKKKEVMQFERADAGKTVFFCARYENSKGVPGAWGPITKAIIPF